MEEIEPILLEAGFKYACYTHSKAAKYLDWSCSTLRTRLAFYFDDASAGKPLKQVDCS